MQRQKDAIMQWLLQWRKGWIMRFLILLRHLDKEICAFMELNS